MKKKPSEQDREIWKMENPVVYGDWVKVLGYDSAQKIVDAACRAAMKARKG